MGKRADPCHQGEKIPKNVVGLYLPKEGDERPLSRTQLACRGESRSSANPVCLIECLCREGNMLATILLSWN